MKIFEKKGGEPVAHIWQISHFQGGPNCLGIEGTSLDTRAIIATLTVTEYPRTCNTNIWGRS